MKLMLEVGTVDLDARTVDHASGRTRLSSTEARLLRYLASRPNETISRDELYEKVWQYRPGLQTRTLDLAMFRLRKKVERNPREPAHLLTAYGSGYTFTPLGGPADTSEVSLDTPQTAFGHETTTFVGREAERQALTELLGPVSRCVTVLGPPGIVGGPCALMFMLF